MSLELVVRAYYVAKLVQFMGLIIVIKCAGFTFSQVCKLKLSLEFIRVAVVKYALNWLIGSTNILYGLGGVFEETFGGSLQMGFFLSSLSASARLAWRCQG